ncbi:ABC transporter G family member 31 [Alnus glutinosa]|uniref:ABC transporter G family member 31 n=1 Tax=Alnus glutinosa TaxID=3517 RepID=UPI002D7814A3|nr:ABC transporter G family member 31 [Alnus glutinosa]
MAATDGSEYFEIGGGEDSFGRPSNADFVAEDEEELRWAAIESIPSRKRTNFALLRRTPSELGGEEVRTETIDVRKLNRFNRELVVKKAMATNEQDNYTLLSAIKKRLDRVGLEVPKVEVRYENLKIVADVQTGARALPTLINASRDVIENILTSLRIFQSERHSLTILNNVSGVLKPGRMTLLLGPPGSGKSTLLLALAGKLDSNLKKSGSITYNAHKLDEFCVQRTSAYISQTDNHIAELTVRETLDFAARCQGASEGFAGYMKDLERLEKERNIRPSPEIDAFMKASSVGGKKHSVSTDYVLKVLGLDVCSETVVGNDMHRGISGGQRKRVTTGEMVVGPRKALFMDEISTGLDSSTTYQIVKCVRNFVHQMEATVLMALLQPAPETFELFDDLVLLAEGYIVYQGPRAEVLEFFETLGFRLPPRKGVADFLQEVTSRKDQAQYWADSSKPYVFLSVPEIAEAFKSSRFGKSLESSLSVPYDKCKSHPLALYKMKFAASKLGLFKACFGREMLLISRHRFLYTFRTCQVAFIGLVTCTLFLRTRLHPTDELNGDLYLSCLFFGLVHMMFNGFSELPLMISRLPVFYKQRDNFFHPASAWSVASWILRVPYSIIEAVVWSCVVYYTVGFAPSAGRFFRFMFLLFSVHQMALGLFRLMAAIARDMVLANTFGSAALLVIFLMGGFIIPKSMIKPWAVWAFWLSPLSYGQNAISVNEFTATRWMERSALGNNTVGYNILNSHSLPTQDYWYWLGVGALLLYAILFNNMVTLALAFLNPLQKAQTVVIPLDATEESSALDDRGGQGSDLSPTSAREGRKKKGMILPFQPLTMTFHNVNYFVDMPKEMRVKGITEKKLQLLSNVSGVFSPGVLTALVGSSGAGKTTMMDVLAGRKTGGYIEGDIRISGHPKEQRTFARISGYVEQNDIHSPQVTVEESLWFSSSLRLPKEVSKEKRHEFVEEVMRLVELETLRHALVGLPGRTGLSTEQRKRLTIAVELVANPSIIFMDEPTSGLDARAAAIVMRTVRNTVDTGRTVVCTIHQPSIDIFEAFDELLLMKRGGQVIYGGKLGVNSQILINYFQGISGIPPIPSGYNPATWMLEVTTPAAEERIGEDFAEIYWNSEQFRNVEASIKHFSIPPDGSEPLKFSSRYSQDKLFQFRACLWKQNLVYWRIPQYNGMRLCFTTISALILGLVFWNVGLRRSSTQDLLVVMGALYSACLFLGVNNASSVQPIVSIERTVFYREKAAGMYSPIAYAAAQGLVEIPYIAVQTIVYGVITYFMINFERTIRKFLLYLLFMFLTFTYFTFYGMMAVGLTSSQHLAAIISSAFYSLWNLLSGFLVPKSHIPGWWIWFYYMCPVAWTLRGIITSQLGDVETKMVGAGFDGSVKEYLEVSLGYSPGMVGVSAAVLISFCLFFFSIFAISLKVLNFQRR